jgi:O-antigen/teichoic acid export membrane protein
VTRVRNRPAQPAYEQSSPEEGRALAGLARSGAANLVGSGVSAVCQLLVVLAVTRTFTQADAGAFFAATAIFLIVVAAVEVGVDQGMVRFLAWHRARNEHGELRAILRIGLLPVVGTSVVGAVIVLALAGPIAGWLGSGDDAAGTANLLRILAAAVPLAALNDIVLAATRGYGVMRPTVVIERMIRPALQPLAIIVVGAAGGGVTMLALAWAGPYLVGVLLSAAALRQLRRRDLARNARPPTDAVAATSEAGSVAEADGHSLARRFWSYTSARAIARVCQVALQRFDVILVAALLGTREAAIYTAATRFIAVGMLLNQAMQQVIQPRLASLLAVDEHDLAELVLRRSTLWLVALAWPGYLAIIALAPWLMSIFGDGYESGAATLVILGIAMLAATAAGPLDVVLLMAGRSTTSLANMVAGLVVDIVGCVVLLPVLGVTGAAYAWAAAIVVRNGLAIWATKRMLRLSAASRELAVVSVWAVLLCGAVQVPLGIADITPAVVLPLLLVGTAAYLAMLWRRRKPLGLADLGSLRRRPPRVAPRTPA